MHDDDDQRDDQDQDDQDDDGGQQDRSGRTDRNDEGQDDDLASLTPEQLRARVEAQQRNIRQLRSVEKSFKKLNRDHETLKGRLDADEKAKLDATEREKQRADAAEAERDRLQGEVRKRAVRAAVQLEAVKLGFHNPEDAYLFIDLDDIEFDDDGEPQGVRDLVKDLAKQRDYLVAKDGGNGTSGRNPPPPSDRSQRAPGKFTPEQDAEHKSLFKRQTKESF